MNTIHVDFPHGLGDCVYFAHLVAVYQAHGHKIAVHCDEDKKVLFQPLQTSLPPQSGNKVPWNHGQDLEALDDTNHYLANKAFVNFSVAPMPAIDGSSPDLWNEFAKVRLDVLPQVSPLAKVEVARFFETLPRPIVLLHTKGNSFQKSKSVPDDLAIEIYREILDSMDGTLVLLDWDNRVPRIAHGRIKHLTDDWKRIGVNELLAAIIQADLVVGIDSGPLHLCQYADTPAIGLWLSDHHPAKYSRPRDRQVNLTLKRHAQNGNRYTRWFYNIVEDQSAQIKASTVGRLCRQMLGEPRYFDKSKIGRDVMLRHWIDDWTRAGVSDHQTFIDRNKSFDLMLRHLSALKSCRIVETGCIRAEEDWRGAGFGTYLLGAFAAAVRGRLDSVDANLAHCEFALKWTRVFGDAVNIHHGDSIDYLRRRSLPVDLLYLDSWDTYVPGYAEHGLREIQEAERSLGDQSMVVYDDTSFRAGKWQGNGLLGVPWLIERGWSPVHVGHQTVLKRGC